MSEIADRYRRLSDDVATTIAAVPADRWGQPSPCPDWTAREVVAHLVDTQSMFLGFVGRELPAWPSVEDDPAAAWDHVRSEIQAGLDDPDRAAATFDGITGPTTFEQSVDRFLNTDLVLHRWDLAQATGQDITLDPADMAHARESMADLEPGLRTPGAFGPELEPPDGADEQTAFLAWAGRRG
jgi:uncharacterized protein (TIGR03086 family)